MIRVEKSEWSCSHSESLLTITVPPSSSLSTSTAVLDYQQLQITHRMMALPSHISRASQCHVTKPRLLFYRGAKKRTKDRWVSMIERLRWIIFKALTRKKYLLGVGSQTVTLCKKNIHTCVNRTVERRRAPFLCYHDTQHPYCSEFLKCYRASLIKHWDT